MNNIRYFSLLTLLTAYCVLGMTIMALIMVIIPQQILLDRPPSIFEPAILFPILALFFIHSGWGLFAGIINYRRGYKNAPEGSWGMTNVAHLAVVHGVFVGSSMLASMKNYLKAGEFFPKVEYSNTFSKQT